MNLYYLNLILLHLLIAFIVNLPEQDKATKNWAKLFGWAQVIMAVQVLVVWQAASALGAMAYTLSALNNLFYLGAALILLENLGGGWRYLLSNRKFQLLTLASVLAVGLLAADWLLAGAAPNLAARSGEAAVAVIVLISIVVYLVEGAAYFHVLGIFGRRWIRYLPVLIAFISSILEFLIWSTPEDFPRYAIYISGVRYLYYISTLLIVLTRTPQDVKAVFGKAAQERKFILAKDTGFVEAVGESTAAHKVLLLIKKPDFTPDESCPIEDNFIHFGWRGKGRGEADGDKGEAGGGKDDLLADITEEEQRCVYGVCQSAEYGVWKSPDGKETIAVPIIMYGGMIGVLFVRLYKGVRARAIFVEKLKHAVLAILPLVQSSRHMAAIRMLSDRFTTNLIGDRGAGRAWGDGAVPSVTEGVEEILDSLLKTLSPLAVALKPSAHFNSGRPVLWRIEEKEFPVARKSDLERRYFAPEPVYIPHDEVVPFQQELELGRLIMFVRPLKDALGRPTMGIHENVFKALGALINNTLKTIIRRNLDRILSAADERISEAGTDGQQIVRVMQEAAHAFGVSWVVVALDQSRFFGDAEKVALVRRRADAAAGDGEFTPVKVTTPGGPPTWVVASSTSWEVSSPPKGNGSARHRIAFWFGVERPDFKWDGMWEGILWQFTQFGTNKIKDMLMKEMEIEIEKKIAEIEKSKPIMALVNHQGNLTHQFGTLIKEVECAVENLVADAEEFKPELPARVGQDVVWLKESYDELLKLTRSMFRETLRTRPYKDDSDEEGDQRCDLRKAINKALANVELKSNRLNIRISQDGPHREGELPVEAPFHVAYLSIYNLLSNSIKALSGLNGQPGEKMIDITTEVNGENVYCRIRDTGHGIKEVDKLYELDSGLGLYITKVSLQDNNCTIDLVETGPSGTTFDLRFPVSRQK